MASGSAMTAEPYGREGLPLEQALAQILEALQPLGLADPLPLSRALGRTTAEAVQAVAAVPGFRASIMDGYAIAAARDPVAAGGSLDCWGPPWGGSGRGRSGAHPHGCCGAAGE